MWGVGVVGCCFGVSGFRVSGFSVQGSGLRVWGLGFGVRGLGSVKLGVGVSGAWVRVGSIAGLHGMMLQPMHLPSGIRVSGFDFEVWGLSFRVGFWGQGFRVWSLGFRFSGLEFGVRGFRSAGFGCWECRIRVLGV